MKQRKKATGKIPVKKIILSALTVLVILTLLFARVFRTCQRVQDRKSTAISRATEDIKFRKDSEVMILGSDNKTKARIAVEIANTPDKQAMGLMFRKEMGEEQGMLFIFDDLIIRDFWMKNTILSLDMLFIDEKMEIITIHEKTTPLTEEEYSSTAPAKYVIEVNAGFCGKYSITRGDKIRLF